MNSPNQKLIQNAVASGLIKFPSLKKNGVPKRHGSRRNYLEDYQVRMARWEKQEQKRKTLKTPEYLQRCEVLLRRICFCDDKLLFQAVEEARAMMVSTLNIKR